MRTKLLVPTTVRFHPGLHHRLKALSEKQGKTLSEIVEFGIRQFLEQQEQIHIDQMYSSLFELAGMCKEPLPQGSRTVDIDEELYGKHGAWKGNRA